ncbi:hypothetical protein [Micromonospora yangpuensis]|nr:hypothetical protein [Micromonospora yangpuensis]
MQPGVSSLDLSVGFQRSRTGRVISLTVAGFLLVVLCGCLGAILGQFVTMGRNAQLSAVLALASGALAALGTTLLVVRTARLGATLTGTRLTVTGLTSRTVDLRTATSVSLHATADSHTGVASDGSVVATGGSTRTPVLTVTGPEGTVRLRLRGAEGVLVPAGQMVALADALGWAHCPGAREAAGWLRAMAADPRTMLL